MSVARVLSLVFVACNGARVRLEQFSGGLETGLPKGCTPIKARFMCRDYRWPGEEHLRPTDDLPKENELPCISAICDLKQQTLCSGSEWEAEVKGLSSTERMERALNKCPCCALRDELLQVKDTAGVHRITADKFKYVEGVEFKRPELVMGPIHVDVPQVETVPSCVRQPFTVSFGAFDVKFSLPETPAEKIVERTCGHTSASAGDIVKFKCSKDLKWSVADGFCADPAEAKACAAMKFVVNWKTPEKVLDTALRFELPHTPNKFNANIRVDMKCPEGSVNTDASAEFRCNADLRWEAISSEACMGDAIAEPKPSATSTKACRAHGLRFTLGDHATRLEMPSADVGEAKDFDCVFDDKKFKTGSMKFVCQEGGWAFTGDSCQDEAPVKKACRAHGLKFSLGSHETRFEMPAADVGETKEFGCTFKDKTFEMGSMNFVCKEGGWALEGQTCKDKPKAKETKACRKSGLRFALGDHSTRLEMPAADAGEEKLFGCNFDNKKFKTGSMKFVCQEGGWGFDSDTCRDGLCSETKFTVDFKGAAGKVPLMLPASEAGELVVPCGDGFTGEATFSCAGADGAGRFSFKGGECKKA